MGRQARPQSSDVANAYPTFFIQRYRQECRRSNFKITSLRLNDFEIIKVVSPFAGAYTDSPFLQVVRIIYRAFQLIIFQRFSFSIIVNRGSLTQYLPCPYSEPIGTAGATRRITHASYLEYASRRIGRQTGAGLLQMPHATDHGPVETVYGAYFGIPEE